MAEEANEVVAEVTTEAPVEQTTEVESSTTEQAADEVTDDGATSDDTEDVDETETAETDDTAEEVVADETLAPKSQNRFQKLANENRDLRAKIAKLEEVAIPTEQDYLDGGYDEAQAKLNALEAKFQQREAIDNISSLNSAVDNDMARIIHEYPALDPQNKSFKKDLAVKLFAQYDKDSGAQYSEDGIVLNTNQLPYEYIKEKMDLIGMASAQERVTAQKNVEKMVAAAETPTSQAPAVSSDETLDQMRERLSNAKF
jgi:hypothetical protein